MILFQYVSINHRTNHIGCMTTCKCMNLQDIWWDCSRVWMKTLFGAIYTDKKLPHPSFWPWAAMKTQIPPAPLIAPVWCAFDWPSSSYFCICLSNYCHSCSSLSWTHSITFSIDVPWSLKAELNDTELAALWRTAVMLAENHGGFDACQKSEKIIFIYFQNLSRLFDFGYLFSKLNTVVLRRRCIWMLETFRMWPTCIWRPLRRQNWLQLEAFASNLMFDFVHETSQVVWPGSHGKTWSFECSSERRIQCNLHEFGRVWTCFRLSQCPTWQVWIRREQFRALWADQEGVCSVQGVHSGKWRVHTECTL